MSRRPRKDSHAAALQNRLHSLPDAPGVYLHKDRQGKVLYVGKAKRLSQRIRSYFREAGDRDPKTQELRRRIADVDYIATASETEALVLESQLIKEYRPRYNIQLKDDKRYPYLKVTLQEPYPRILVVRRIEDDGARYFGPYTDVRAMRDSLRLASGVFQVRTCHLDLPDRTVARPCLDYHIGRCTAPCVGMDQAREYNRRVRQLVLFLEGADRTLQQRLQRQMRGLALAYRYEDAAKVRDRIGKLETTISRSRPVPGLTTDLDACGVVRDGDEGCGVILRIRRGKVLTVHDFHLQDRLERAVEDFQAQLLREYYPRAGDIPPEVLLGCELPDRLSWTAWLTSLRGRRVRLVRPRRGPKRAALDMALQNAAFKLRQYRAARAAVRGAAKRITPADVQLQDALGLHTVPETIECFDISNFQGREAVGSLVYFKRGHPVKSRYRRFRIRQVARSDDYAMLREILGRYYGRLAEHGAAPADLVVIDGGPGQLSSAREVLGQLGFHAAQIVGLAKRDEVIHRERRQPPLRLGRANPALQLLQRVRDEAHRFAISYHRLLRDRRTTDSQLDRIPGIGRVKKLSLLHHFGSVERIRKAALEQLGHVRGLSQRDVVNIWNYFQREEKQG
jgi:excinuclease ABC subunit C